MLSGGPVFRSALTGSSHHRGSWSHEIVARRAKAGLESRLRLRIVIYGRQEGKEIDYRRPEKQRCP
jgi:hypothetical protein